jgi:hypothetical protein
VHRRLQGQGLVRSIGGPPQQGMPVGVGIRGAVSVVALAVALEQLYVKDARVCAAAGGECTCLVCYGACLHGCVV